MVTPAEDVYSIPLTPSETMTSTTRVTADQLLHMPKDGYHHYELVAGELRI